MRLSLQIAIDTQYLDFALGVLAQEFCGLKLKIGTQDICTNFGIAYTPCASDSLLKRAV